MKYLSLFSGCESATVAWHPIGWTPVAFAEIEPACCALLAHHYSTVPNLGEVTRITQVQVEDLGNIDVVIFGSPCQDLSIAGKRKGLKGARSGLFFDAMRIVRWSRARFALFENVPGLFSSHQGRDFAAVVGEMAGVQLDVPDSGWRNTGVCVGDEGLVEWGVLDAQWFGVPQRRRRIFALRDIGDWRSRPPILLERESLSGHPAPSRETGKDIAPTLAARTRGGGGLGTDFDCDGGLICDDIANAIGTQLAKRSYSVDGNGAFVAHTLRADGFDASEDGTGRGTPQVPIAFSCKDHGADAGDISPTLRSMGHDKSHANAGGQVAVAFDTTQITSKANRSNPQLGDPCHPLAAGAHVPAVGLLRHIWRVRRITPTEASRLQGFPDDYLEVKYADAVKAHTAQILHELWKAAHAFAREGWRPSIVASLLTPEVLLAGVHGGWVSWSVAAECTARRGSLSGAEPWPTGLLRALRINSQSGSSPYRQEHFEQCARELGRSLSELPLERTQVAWHLYHSGLWQAAQEEWPLRYAFAKEEGKKVGLADGPKYKMLGNSMAVPVIRKIGERIAMVEGLSRVACEVSPEQPIGVV